ncbi:MAG: tetratricopeptide repeat protein [Candidatus Heimdallarchaeota archaeon]|nr:tetratricopeptide repeat protein [Candidatus Heimdallarchaeota archaeon]
MEENLLFPEILHFIAFFSEQEQEVFKREKVYFKNNTLETQLKLLQKIMENSTKQSDMLLFTVGKILYNLVEYDKILELWKENASPYLLFWLGLAEYRKGNFKEAESHLTKVVFSEDELLKLEGKIGLARISERRGNKKDASVLVRQVFDQLENYDSKERGILFVDTKLRGLFGELWTQRTERNVEHLIKQAKDALMEAEQYADRIHIAEFHVLLGILYKYLGRWNISKEHFEISRSIFRDIGNLRGEVTVLSNYADVERMEGKLDSALGRLLSVISLYTKWEDKRSQALVYSSLGQIYAQKKQFDTAIKELSTAKAILKEIDAIDEQVDFALAELLVEQKNWTKFNEIMAEILSRKTTKEIENNPTIMFLYGKKEIQNLNLTKAKNYLRSALKLAGEKSLDHLGAKILVVSLQIILYNYISHPEEYSLIEASKFIDDLKIFIEETQKDTIFIHLIEGIENYYNKISKEENKSKQRTLVLEMQKTIKELADLIRYSSASSKELGLVLPNQIVILHRSGIPIKRYVRSKKIVDDILLFGGMVRAAQDIVTEVFTKEAGKLMKIDYGDDIIILAEFGNTDAGIVLITSKDTFHQRRALHEAIKDLTNVILPQKFHGDIEINKEEKIDDIVEKWFGEGYTGERG